MKGPNWYTTKQIIRLYALAIVIFSIFRLILFFTEFDKITYASESISLVDILKAFLMGVRFDIVIIGYLILIPYVLLSFAFIINRNWKIYHKFIFYYIFLSFSIAFAIFALDIPYFEQFFSHLTIGAFYSMDTPLFIFKMILEEPRFWLFIILFILTGFAYHYALKKIHLYPTIISFKNNKHKFLLILKRIFITLFLIIFIFAGIRGRLASKSPIRVGTAYFCNNPFLNQLGLNPSFTLFKSYLNSRDLRTVKCNLMDGEEAVRNVQKYLQIKPVDPHYPIARQVTPDTISKKKHNVVVVIMEGMSYAKMSRYGNTKNLTPFLDSISSESYFFENIYTSGIHTYNGIFTTLFSYPTIFTQHPMKGIEMLRYNGISNELKKHGYSSTYFCTHDGQFDNVEGFLKSNNFSQIIEQSNYPQKKVTSILGVPDDYLFKFSLPYLNESYKNDQPFFAAYMTASNHGPYVIPEYFTPKNDNIKDQIVEYSDWSLRKFIDLASKTEWFENTIFVFIADHGGSYDVTYSRPMNYSHSPLIIYAPKILKNKKTYNCIGGQIDVFPTIMGLLNLPYINNTLGIDLLKEKRQYIYFASDYEYCVVGNEYYLIENLGISTGLYKYRKKDLKNYVDEKPETVKEMQTYAESNLQAFQYIMDNRMQFVDSLSSIQNISSK